MINTNPEERKIFLQNLEKMAAAAASIQEIAYKLDFKNADEFEKFLKEDKEARNIWKQARTDCWTKARAAIVIAAQSGQAKAIEVLDKLLMEEQSNVIISGHVTAAQLAKLIGRTYQTVNNWRNKNGLPREEDTTYSLLKFFEWYGKYKTDLGKKQASEAKGNDALREMKAKELEIKLETIRGDLLNREEVLAGICARHQLLKQQHILLPELATRLEKKSYEQIVAELEKFFIKLLASQEEDFTELKLPAKIRNMFLNMLKALGAQA